MITEHPYQYLPEPPRDPTPETPHYRKVAEDRYPPPGTQLWMIVCDEGWRESIVCNGMYEWAADWLVNILESKPYAPESRPDATPRDVPSQTHGGS